MSIPHARKTRARIAVAVGCAIAAGALAALLVFNVRITRSELGAAKRAHAQNLQLQSLRTKFVLLRDRRTNRCGLQPASLESLPANSRLQGSCCQQMDFGSYTRQIEALKRYSGLAVLPADPYDVPVDLAKRLTALKRLVRLNALEAAVYHQALRLSREHGPCCCHCWRWTVFEGQARYLIHDLDYDARQIATIWNLEDGCGGRRTNV